MCLLWNLGLSEIVQVNGFEQYLVDTECSVGVGYFSCTSSIVGIIYLLHMTTKSSEVWLSMTLNIYVNALFLLCLKESRMHVITTYILWGFLYLWFWSQIYWTVSVLPWNDRNILDSFSLFASNAIWGKIKFNVSQAC